VPEETLTLEQLATDIRAKLDAISGDVAARVSDERLTQLVKDAVEGLAGDEEFARKLRFGGGPERQLVGTKYARWGLSLGDVEFLYDLQNSLRGQRRVSDPGVYEGPSDELSRTFDAVSEAYYLPQDKVRELDRQAIDNLFPRLPLSQFHGRDRELARAGKWELTRAYQLANDAMDTAESGFGQQLVGAQYVGDLWEAPRRLGRVFPLIDSFEMTAPSSFLPVEVDIPEMLFVAENTGSNSSEYPTGNTGSQRVQVDARKFVIHQMWSGEMEEDAILPFIPFLRRQAALSVAHYSDSLVLNGDTTTAGTGNINSDDAAPASTKHYLAFNGIRKAAIIDNTGNAVDAAGGVTLGLLNQLRGKMIDLSRLVDWGHPTDAGDLVYLADPETADRIAMIDEVLTVDKYGQNATILNGELARIGPYPHVSTIAMSKTAADGKADSATPANNVKGQVACFNRRGFKTGWRRRVMVESDRVPGRDQTRIFYSLRLGFGRFTPTGAASGIEAASVLYDVTV